MWILQFMPIRLAVVNRLQRLADQISRFRINPQVTLENPQWDVTRVIRTSNLKNTSPIPAHDQIRDADSPRRVATEEVMRTCRSHESGGRSRVFMDLKFEIELIVPVTAWQDEEGRLRHNATTAGKHVCPPLNQGRILPFLARRNRQFQHTCT